MRHELKVCTIESPETGEDLYTALVDEQARVVAVIWTLPSFQLFVVPPRSEALDLLDTREGAKVVMLTGEDAR